MASNTTAQDTKQNVKEVNLMSSKELLSYLEAVKIIATNAKTTAEIIAAIEQLQKKLQE